MTQYIGQSPKQYYQALIQQQAILADPSQQAAIEQLNEIWEKLERPKAFFIQRPIRGLYMWGSVGSGKTWLMDIFYQSLSYKKKVRIHFHHFLKNIHQQLVHYRGTRDPLQHIANDLIKKYKLICFDEFFVSNVTDAMILSNLFNLLFAKRVILVATSNIDPDNLYKHGLHRERFLPTIHHIHTHCHILKIGNALDYRVVKGHHVLDQFFFSPLDAAADAWLSSIYRHLTQHNAHPTLIQINHRDLEALGVHERVAWFSFDRLCRDARSPADFIELCRRYDHVLISNITELTDAIYDAVRRFIYLIDELYEQKVVLYLTAEQPIEQLYTGEKLKFEFQRTFSRLQEMQSRDYHEARIAVTHKEIH